MPEPGSQASGQSGDPMIGALLEDYLSDLGCETIGPIRTVADALQAIETETISAAILDVSLEGGITRYPIAEILTERRTPFAFSTGFGKRSIQAKFAAAQTLPKPCVFEDLKTVVESWGMAPSSDR